MARIQSTGKCCFCSSTFNKSAMTRHLKSCKEREAKWKSSLENNEKHRTKFFHLLVEGRYLPEYWMHLLVKANITLDVRYLSKGHLVGMLRTPKCLYH